METHLSSFGQDRTEENGVVTFHLSQNGIGCFNQPSTAFPPFLLLIKILDFLRSGFCSSATTTKIVCLTPGVYVNHGREDRVFSTESSG